MHELTAFEIKALRAADDVAFYHREDGSGLIRAIKRADYKVPFSEDRSVEIEAQSGFHNYAIEEGFIPKTAFALVGSYKFGTMTLTTALNMLRSGDRVRLEWSVDGHRNGYVKDAGLHADALYLLIERQRGGRWRQVAGFEITNGVNPGNSARMIRGEFRPVPAEEVTR